MYGQGVRDALLDDLDPSQFDAVTSDAAPLAIIAPAGSGKTRVLTRRIAYRCREDRIEARHVLAVTFTRKAAGELISRIDKLGVDGRITAGTFHAIALGQLRRRAAEHNREVPQVVERKARILAPLLGGRGAASSIAVSDVATEIEWAKARLIKPEGYEAAAEAAGRRPPRGAGAVAALYARYETEKRRRHLIDFDDVLSQCAEAIEQDEVFAAGQRWRFRHFFVDEFQDATPLQLRLLRAWLGASAEVTVVGDPAQAIYGFTGADAAPLVRFERAFPGGETITLARNYRSTPAVVSLAEVALGAAAGPARLRPEAVRPDGAAPTIVAYPDDVAEADATAEACREYHSAGVPWQDMAVLFRTNAQSSRFETAFTRREIPFRIGDGQRFTARTHVRAVLDELRGAERDSPGRPFAQHLADLAAGNETGAEPTRAQADAAPTGRDGDDGTPTEAEAVRDAAADEARSHRDSLLELGREYLDAVGGAGSVAEFVVWLDLATSGSTGRAPGIDLVTFHRAKGLEWSVVFVTGLERGLVPISWAIAAPAQAEERRLLHVALSRAEDELHCSWSNTRVVGGRRAQREPSPWLGDLENEANHAPHGLLRARRSPRDHLAELRATLAAASPPIPPPERAHRLRG